MTVGMNSTPGKHDEAAENTETLMAVAVLLHPHLGDADIPYADFGSAGIEWLGDIDQWLCDLPGWDTRDVNCQLYVVAEGDYRPLRELGVRAATELGAFPFFATEQDVDRVREAAARKNQCDDRDEE